MVYDLQDDYYVQRQGITKDDFLTAEQERELFTAYQTGTEKESQEALEKLVRSQYSLVFNLASKRLTEFLAYEDKIQEGLIGLLEAIKKFDLSRGVRLSSYAYRFISQYISNAIAHQELAIRLPAHAFELRNKIRAVIYKLSSVNGEQPTNEEIAAELSLPVDTIVSYRASVNVRVISYDAPLILDDEGETTLLDMLPAETAAQGSRLDAETIRDALTFALSFLTPKEQYIIKERFGLNEGLEPKTSYVLAEEIRVTHQSILQTEHAALRRIRKNARAMRALATVRASYN